MKYCNKKYKNVFESDLEMATVVLNTDYYSQGKGFSLKYHIKKFPAKEKSDSPSDFCKRSWLYYNGNCYKHFRIKEAVTWIEASNFCATEISNLVSILDSKEMDVLMNWLLYTWYIYNDETPSFYLGSFFWI